MIIYQITLQFAAINITSRLLKPLNSLYNQTSVKGPFYKHKVPVCPQTGSVSTFCQHLVPLHARPLPISHSLSSAQAGGGAALPPVCQAFMPPVPPQIYWELLLLLKTTTADRRRGGEKAARIRRAIQSV